MAFCILQDFYEIWPEKFQNKTNGVTQVSPLVHALFLPFNSGPLEMWEICYAKASQAPGGLMS